MTESPLVSCIMPTCNRRAFVPQAIAYFLRQDYPERELIIIDDGPEPVGDLVPEDGRIRYVRRRKRLAVGAKRNLACEAAAGELIAHWDDDDWMAAGRLRYQVEALLAGQADICGLDRLFFYKPAAGRAWQYVYPAGHRPWLAGGTFCYTKDLWRRSSFPNLDIGEDTRFVWGRRSGKMVALPDNSFYVALIHNDNVSPKRTGSSRWQACSERTVRAFLGPDAAFYAALGQGGASREASRPETRPPQVGEPGSRALLDEPGLTWDGWAISKSLAATLADRLEQSRPRRILELGSGTSTLFLAQYAARWGATLVVLEHERRFFEQTRRLLRRLGLLSAVELKLAPLKPKQFAGGERYNWYETALAGRFDFIFVDGPPIRWGRQAALLAVAGQLAPGWELWLKDGRRSHERACVALWRKHIQFSSRLQDMDPRGVWVLKDDPVVKPNPADPRPAARPEITAPPEPEAGSQPPVEQGREAPLVSCLMPTYNRRRFVPQAVAYFQRQDYPNRELIIIDDGSRPVADLIPQDPMITYVRCPRKQSIGAKRNRACEQAGGEILVLWDDDDWYGPQRLTRQVEPLIADRADITGLEQLLLLELSTGQFWQCAAQLHARMFFQGTISGTLAFRKRLWEKGARFPNASIAEDAAFHKILTRRGARIEKVAAPDAFIYIRHGANSWNFTPGQFLDRGGWGLVATPSFLPAQDLEFYGLDRRPPLEIGSKE